MSKKIITQNKRARFEYEILDRYEAGMVLQGTEVKSLRAGHVTLKDSYADVVKGELYLVGAHINPYEMGNIYNHDPERPRKLLMHRQEITRISSQIAEKGLTLVPLSLYFLNGKVKIELGLGRGKNTRDKRDTIRDRDVKREMDIAMKNAQRDN